MEGDTHWLPHNALPVPGAEVPPMPELRAASAEAPPAGRLGWGLVERVADVFLTKAFTADDPVGARAAIRELAAWLSEHTDDDASAYWATRLELEADRG
jgi:hypothetical protein